MKEITENDLKKNEEQLRGELIEAGKALGESLLRGYALGELLKLAFGAGAKTIGIVIEAFRSCLKIARKMAESSIRKAYQDDRITVLGQQIGPSLPSEDVWAFVNRFGGVVWVQNVPITRSEALALVAFWHPDHKFKLANDIIRVYRSVGSQCLIESDSGPTIRAAR